MGKMFSLVSSIAGRWEAPGPALTKHTFLLCVALLQGLCGPRAEKALQGCAPHSGPCPPTGDFPSTSNQPSLPSSPLLWKKISCVRHSHFPPGLSRLIFCVNLTGAQRCPDVRSHAILCVSVRVFWVRLTFESVD